VTLWAQGRYESVGRRIADIAVQTVDAAERRTPLSGAAVVDLACGTGSAAVAAASRGARVTGVDLTRELLDIARTRSDEVTWVCADASDTGLPAASFDVAVSNMGIIFVDPTRQVPELQRLLKPGGVLAFSAWVRQADNPLSAPIAAVFGGPPPGAFTPDQWGDTEIASRRLAAGFDDLTFDFGTCTWQFADLDEAMTFVRDESPMHVSAFEHADPTQRDRLTDGFAAALREHADDSGTVAFDAPYVVVTARRAPG
jgi:SAM-dependent methyltransferase